MENADGLELSADSHNPDVWGAIPTHSSTVLTSLREYSLLLGKEELTASIQKFTPLLYRATDNDWQGRPLGWLTWGVVWWQWGTQVTPTLVSAMLQKKKKGRQFLVVSSELSRKRMFPKSKTLYTCYFYLRLNSCCDVNYSPRLRPPQTLDFPGSSSGHSFPAWAQEAARGTTRVSGQTLFIIRNLFLPAS